MEGEESGDDVADELDDMFAALHAQVTICAFIHEMSNPVRMATCFARERLPSQYT